MKKYKTIFISLILIMIISLCGCDSEGYILGNVSNDSSSNQEENNIENNVTYLAMLFDNHGNNFLNFEGRTFQITPNKVKQWGYSTSGNWESYYETSSVMSINVDGKYIQSCGSTIIFKDSRLNMLDISDVVDTSGDDIYYNENPTDIKDEVQYKYYAGLKYWWYNVKPKGQDGSKIVLIQSQDGYNIGAFIGNDVQWEVGGKLPKTTLITIDGMKLYIHRCNFSIIDTDLIQN